MNGEQEYKGNGNGELWPGWETVRLIGRGSYGSVYEIRRDMLGNEEHAALKVITIPQNSGDIEEMYGEGYDDESITATFHEHLRSIINEYSLMRKLNGSTNVVSCDDVRYIQHESGLGWDIYIKMELLTPLTKALPQQISEETAMRVGIDLCHALELCKKHDIIHRDIKPQNIFVSDNGDYKLGDFGIAKTVEKTMGGTKVGTYKYMAPEVYNNQPYGGAADIYSLGMVLYWLLNEKRMPFTPLPPAKLNSGAEEAARTRRLSGEPLPAPAHGSVGLQAVVLKACAYDLKERYHEPEVMRADLERVLGGKLPLFLTTSQGVSQKDVVEDTTVVTGGNGCIGIWPSQNITAQDATEREEKTTAAAFVPEKAPARAIEDEEEKTTGAMSSAASPVVPENASENQSENAPEDGTESAPTTAEALDADKTIGAEPAPTPPPEKKKKSKWGYFVAAAAVVVILILLLLHQACYGNVFSNADASPTPTAILTTIGNTFQAVATAAPTDEEEIIGVGIDVLRAPISTETPEPTATPVKQLEWTGWMEKLPKDVTESEYEIEETTQYSSRTKETTSSTSESMDGWTQYDIASAGQDYGEWSDWGTKKISADSNTEVEKKKEYRYQDMEYTTGSSKSKSGWELYDTTYSRGDYGSWSDWSTTKVSSNSNTQVETMTQYRYQEIQYEFVNTYDTNSFSTWDDWQLYDSEPDYNDWESSRTTTTKPTESDTLRIIDTKQTQWGWYHYCCNYYNGCNNVDSISYGSGSHYYHTTYSSWMFPTCGVGDMGGKQAYGGTGSGCVSCGSGFYIWFRNTGADEYEYTYQVRSAEYILYRWKDWSDWSDTPMSSSSTKNVETRTLYRSRTRQKIATYHFRRWGSWTDWSSEKVTSSDTRNVEKRTLYRHREIVDKTTYLFYRWTDWSEYSDTPVAEDENTEVQTRKMYRYRSKTNN